jgi:acetyl/propionyl-CoA carboxylase alpha subunit
MQFDLDIHGRSRRVAVRRGGRPGQFQVTVDGRSWMVDASWVDPRTLSLLIEEGGRRRSCEAVLPPRRGGDLRVHVGTAAVTVGVNGRRGIGRKGDDGPAQAGPRELRAVMPGRVVKVLVKIGDTVKAGQGLVVLEAMKMENELRAARDGKVVDVRAREATSVEAGALLVVIE